MDGATLFHHQEFDLTFPGLALLFSAQGPASQLSGSLSGSLEHYHHKSDWSAAAKLPLPALLDHLQGWLVGGVGKRGIFFPRPPPTHTHTSFLAAV